jgi:hypothetical protein
MKQDSSWRKILDKLLPEFLAFYSAFIIAIIGFPTVSEKRSSA